MKRTAAIGIALLLGSLALTAQNANTPQAQLKFVMPVPLGSSCPIGMHARHEIGLHSRVLVHGAVPADSPGLRLVLTLTNPRPGQIAKARVTVHGLNGKWQQVPTDMARAGSPNVTKTLDLEFVAGEDKSVSADLVLSGFTSVSSIDLDSVTYANGSTWKFSSRDACQVAPDLLMLIAGQMTR